jgi:DMSO/TMAO reductase YedYZ molybdopterin-dependent catalytic subunit
VPTSLVGSRVSTLDCRLPRRLLMPGNAGVRSMRWVLTLTLDYSRPWREVRMEPCTVRHSYWAQSPISVPGESICITDPFGYAEQKKRTVQLLN